MRAPRTLGLVLLLLPVLGAAACGGTVTKGTGGSSTTGTGGAAATSTASSSSGSTGSSSSTGSTSASSTGSSSSGAGSTSASSTGSSSSGEAVYSAYGLITNLPRYVIFKSEPAADRCVRISVAMVAGSQGFGIQTATAWTVEQAEVTDHASDCALSGGYPVVPATSVTATGGSGSITQSPAQFPCMVSIHATLTFPPGQAWVPASEALDADGLAFQGGGC